MSLDRLRSTTYDCLPTISHQPCSRSHNNAVGSVFNKTLCSHSCPGVAVCDCKRTDIACDAVRLVMRTLVVRRQSKCNPNLDPYVTVVWRPMAGWFRMFLTSCREYAVCTSETRETHGQRAFPGLGQSRFSKEMCITVSHERRHPSSRVKLRHRQSRCCHTRLAQRPRWLPLSNIGVGSQLEYTSDRRLQTNRHV